MKKFKTLLLGSVMLFSLGMLTACGDVPEPTEDDVVDALVDEDFLSKEQKKEGKYEIKIDEVDINDDKDRATVECSFTMKDGPLSKTTEYEIKFKIRDDKESWKTRKVTAGDVKTELTAEITEDEIKDALTYSSFYVEDEYISMSSDDVTYKVGKHKLDKKEMTDTVVITGNTSSGYLDIEFEVEYEFRYGSSWYINEYKVVESSSEYVDGYEIDDIKAEELEEMLAEEDESFWVMGYSYYIDSDEASISEVELGDIEYNGSYAYVDMTFTVVEEDVEFVIESEMVLKYDTDDNKWSYNYFNDTELVAYKCGAIGVWNGTMGENTVVITINDELVEDEAYLSASVTITTPAGVTGTYDAYVYEYEPGNEYMSIETDDWTTKPADDSIYMEDFYGYYDETITTFTPDYSYKDWSFTKQQ